MNLFSEIKSLVLTCLAKLEADGRLPAGLDTSNVSVEPPRDPAHGDMATNAAMVLAKAAKQKPRDIAEALAEALLADDRVIAAEVAGPGFLNLRLEPTEWRNVILAVLKAGDDFGRSDMGAGKKVNVEYVSANPTGPLHVGHTRGAVFGDALASLLDFAGYNVTKEYYINDGGAQVDVLARSAYLRYQEACGRAVEFPDGTYPGDYLIPVGQAIKEKYGDSLLGSSNEDWLPELREFVTQKMMVMIREDLAALGVEMNLYFSEKSLYGTGKIETAIDLLRDKGLIYKGVLEPPKGKKPEDWEPREQTLFKSTDHGDDVDRPIMKSDGSWTYFAPDIAYHHDKIARGFDELINIFGADHSGYVKRMKAAVSALSDGKVPLDIKLTQLVKLFKDGEEFKMSKRAGTFVTLRDLIDEVGSDAVRFVMLTRKNDAPLDFDFAKALEESKDNPVYYVHYAHARSCSVLRRATDVGLACTDADLINADLSQLTRPEELTLTRKIAEWPRLAELAARHNEPHRVAFYLYELAQVFNGLQNLGKQDVALRFISEENPVQSTARLALVRAVSVVISAGLGILGVTPKTEM